MKIKKLFITLGLALAVGLGVGAFMGVKATREIKEAKADATGTAGFARFYFCEGTWGNATNPRIGTQSLQDHFGESTLFVGTGTTSSYAAIDAPNGCYYYIDYELAGKSTCYFRFEQNGAYVYKTDSGFAGSIGDNFYPGHIYTITAGTYRSESGSNKWCDIDVAEIGVLATFDVNGGTQTGSYDYKEFKGATALFSAPTRSGYTFNGWLCEQDGFVTKAGGSYTADGPRSFKAQWVSNTQTVVGSGKTRIWVGYNGTVDSVFYKERSIIKLVINDSVYLDSTGIYYNVNENIDGSSDCPRRYDYFDIDASYFESGARLKVQRGYRNGEGWQTSAFYVDINNSYSTYAFKVLYCPSSWETGAVIIGGLSATDSLFATLAIAGIHTCSNAVINGFGGYGAFYDTFVQDNDVASDMDAYRITDFATKSDYSSNDDINKSVSAYDKFLWVRYMADPEHNSEPEAATSWAPIFAQNSSSYTVVIVSVSAFTLLAVIAFVLLKKKKEQK